MAVASSESAIAPMTKIAKLWLNVKRKIVAYATSGRSTVSTPAASFCMSFTMALILFLAAALRKSLISKILAAATDIMIRKGMRILENEEGA